MKLPLPRLARIALFALPLIALAANTAITPEPRDAGWVRRHEGFVEIAKQGDVDVLFLGDSITDFWRTPSPKGGKKVWDENFGSLKAANFGISADRTQHVLWRLDHGEVDGIKPKVVVLMIGTNNTGLERTTNVPRNTTAEAIEGVTAVVKKLREKLPQTKVLLLAIFPRNEKADDPQRQQVNEINTAIAKLADGKNVRYLDIGPKFLTPDGTLTKEIMPDLLHPAEKGYEIWAAAIKQPLAEMMK